MDKDRLTLQMEHNEPNGCWVQSDIVHPALPREQSTLLQEHGIQKAHSL